MKQIQYYLPLFVITAIGALMRYTNLNWDGGGRLHPDEALIVNGALSLKFFSQMFPGFHDYNGLSVYVLKFFSLHTTDPMQVTTIGRFLSATFSTLTIPLMFFIGKKLWQKDVGLLAALLFALTPLSIQLAHFYTTESIMIFFLTALIYFCVSFAQKQTQTYIVLMAISTGLLLATKNTAYLFVPIPLLTITFFDTTKRFVNGGVLLFLTAIAFFFASPYSFLDYHGYITRSQYLSDVVSGNLLMDWTLQFQQTNGFFWMQNIFAALGPVTLVGLLGAVMALWFKKKSVVLIIALWTVGFLAFLGFTYLKFIRYSAPLLPLLGLFAAALLWQWRKTFAGTLITISVVLTQLVWCVMVSHIYLIPHTSLTASNWIAQNIPANTTILREEWNNVVHFDAKPLSDKNFRLLSFNFYSPESVQKTQQLQEALSQSDWLIMETPKVKSTITRLASIYPQTAEFYKTLQGFTKIAQFSSYPTLGPLVINDETLEETWYAFDHPTITIYQKNK